MNIVRKVRRKIYKALHPALGEVWMLHRVLPEEQRSQDKKRRDLEVTPEFLEAKILEYRSRGYRFVSMDEVCNELTEASHHPFRRKKPFVCVTLDDGYADNYRYAYPLFKKYGIPFVIYITTGFVDRTVPMWWYDEVPEMLSWGQVKQLSMDPLCTIGAHTVTHPFLGQIDLAKAQREMAESKQILEEKLQMQIGHFSYPHGDYTPAVCQVVRDNGFKSSVLVWGGKVRPGQSCLEIPRIPIVQN